MDLVKKLDEPIHQGLLKKSWDTYLLINRYIYYKNRICCR